VLLKDFYAEWVFLGLPSALHASALKAKVHSSDASEQ